MSAPSYGNKSRSIHAAIVDLVGYFLDGEGIEAMAKRHASSISDTLSDDVALAPDLSLPGVHLDVTSRLSPYRLSEDLESAQRAAAIRGVPVGAFVQWRAEREVEQAYVVTSLADFAKLVRGDHLPPP